MSDVFDVLKGLVGYAVPLFVVSTMLNVGLTQRLSKILDYLHHPAFVLKVLIANFVAAPLVMFGLLKLSSFDPALQGGLLLLGLCAGAPFLIALTASAGEDVALGAAIMLLLMVVTVVYVPFVLPRLLSGITVDGVAIAKSLVVQMIIPIALGMLAWKFLGGFARAIQPWVAKLGNIMLYVVMAATLVGYLPDVAKIVGTGAVLVALGFYVAAFGLGWLAGWPSHQFAVVGALGTAQRNTAAGMVIATQNFADHPNVMVMMTLANALGIVGLLFVGKRLKRKDAHPQPTTPHPRGA